MLGGDVDDHPSSPHFPPPPSGSTEPAPSPRLRARQAGRAGSRYPESAPAACRRQPRSGRRRRSRLALSVTPSPWTSRAEPDATQHRGPGPRCGGGRVRPWWRTSRDEDGGHDGTELGWTSTVRASVMRSPTWCVGPASSALTCSPRRTPARRRRFPRSPRLRLRRRPQPSARGCGLRTYVLHGRFSDTRPCSDGGREPDTALRPRCPARAWGLDTWGPSTRDEEALRLLPQTRARPRAAPASGVASFGGRRPSATAQAAGARHGRASRRPSCGWPAATPNVVGSRPAPNGGSAGRRLHAVVTEAAAAGAPRRLAPRGGRRCCWNSLLQEWFSPCCAPGRGSRRGPGGVGRPDRCGGTASQRRRAAGPYSGCWPPTPARRRRAARAAADHTASTPRPPTAVPRCSAGPCARTGLMTSLRSAATAHAQEEPRGTGTGSGVLPLNIPRPGARRGAPWWGRGVVEDPPKTW